MKLDYKLINHAFSLVSTFSSLYKIDESHALRHSLDVFHNAVDIYNSELYDNPFLKDQQKEIFCAAILHDMCDKKYVTPKLAMSHMNILMSEHLTMDQLRTMNDIMSTMSYSYVKKNGYPNLQNYNLAYHIVREADLLAAYDVERCFIYQIKHEDYTYNSSIEKVIDLFNNRVLKYIEDDLFITNYSKQKAQKLHDEAIKRINIIQYFEK